MKQVIGIVSTFLIFATTAVAYDFSAADRAYANREDNVGEIKKAEELYKNALQQVQGREKVYAVEQLGRLYYYWGDMLTGKGDEFKGTRKDIFGRCRAVVENIKGSGAPYYYWKSLCLALWGGAANFIEKMSIKDELVGTLREARESYGSYESGGPHRVSAAVFIRSANIPGVGLYDKKEALKQIDTAIALDTKQLYYYAYVLKAEILNAMGRKADADTLLNAKRPELEDKLEDGLIPAYLIPESKVTSREMFNMMGN